MLVVRPHRMSSVVRITTAARLAAMRPAAPIEVADPNCLRASRLVIRPLTWSDAAEFGRVISISRDHLAERCPMHKEGETDEALFERLLAQASRGFELGRAWRAGVFVQSRLVGLINLNDISRGLESTAEANWWSAADALNRGFATEALRATLRHAFADFPRGLGLQRVTALIAPDNHASRRVAIKAGLRRVKKKEGGDAAICPLTLSGKRVEHELYEIFAPITGSRRAAAWRPSLRAGLAAILDTEAAAREISIQ